MNVIVEFAVLLDVKDVSTGSTLAFPDGAKITDLMTLLKIRPDHQKYIVPFINGRQTKIAEPLKDGDRVYLSLPMGGG